MTQRYGLQMSLLKDLSSSNRYDFDEKFLLPKKSTINYLMGGIFFEGQSTLSGDTVYSFTTITDTITPTACLYLQTLAAETVINQILGSDLSVTVSNSPLPFTYAQSQNNNAFKGFIVSIIISIAFSFKFSSIIGLIVQER